MENQIKKTIGAALVAALILTAPGLPCYRALAAGMAIGSVKAGVNANINGAIGAVPGARGRLNPAHTRLNGMGNIHLGVSLPGIGKAPRMHANPFAGVRLIEAAVAAPVIAAQEGTGPTVPAIRYKAGKVASVKLPVVGKKTVGFMIRSRLAKSVRGLRETGLKEYSSRLKSIFDGKDRSPHGFFAHSKDASLVDGDFTSSPDRRQDLGDGASLNYPALTGTKHEKAGFIEARISAKTDGFVEKKDTESRIEIIDTRTHKVRWTEKITRGMPAKPVIKTVLAFMGGLAAVFFTLTPSSLAQAALEQAPAAAPLASLSIIATSVLATASGLVMLSLFRAVEDGQTLLSALAGAAGAGIMIWLSVLHPGFALLALAAGALVGLGAMGAVLLRLGGNKGMSRVLGTLWGSSIGSVGLFVFGFPLSSALYFAVMGGLIAYFFSHYFEKDGIVDKGPLGNHTWLMTGALLGALFPAWFIYALVFKLTNSLEKPGYR